MFEKFLTTITTISIGLGSLLGLTPQPAPVSPVPQVEEVRPAEDIQVGAFSPAAGGTYRLQTSIGTTDTTITLSSFTEPISGTPITMSSLATDIAYATIDPQSTTRKEFVSFTGISQNSDGTATLTGVSRGLSFLSPFTASSTLRKAHPGQSIFILSDSPQFFNEYARRRSDETITGQWTFNTFPITPSTTLASTTAAGWVELATPQEAASSTASGTIARLVIPASMATSNPTTTSGHVVPVTESNGVLAAHFIPVGSSTVRLYTSTSTWTKPSNIAFIQIWVCGAGGNGGAGNVSQDSGSGGSAGGCGMEVLDSTELSATSSVAIGVSTGAGATSFFGNFCTANSGTNGSTGGSTAAGGTATGCDINLTGGSSQGGMVTSTIEPNGGNGGSSALGGGGGGGTGSSGNGGAGGGYGAGGGGGSGTNGGSAGGGGSGSQGVVIVTEYF